MKELKMKYFGMLAERLGKDEELLQTSAANLLELKQELEAQQWLLGQLPYRMAVNQKMSQESTELTTGDEIALLPPFAGG